MRAMRVMGCLILLACGAGCASLGNLLDGYYWKPKHFAIGTAKEQSLSVSKDRALKNLQLVLQENQITVKNIKQDEEAIQVWASKGGIDYVFDITGGSGEGCQLRMELNQAGNDAETWKVMNEVQMLP